MATRDLSVQAILSANTTPFANGMKSASDAAKRFSADMKKIRQEINQPLYVPKPGGKQTPEMVLFGGTISEGLAAQRFRQIARIERFALNARKKWMEPFFEPEIMERGWVRFGSAADRAFDQAGRGASRFVGAAKKAFSGLGIGLGLAAEFAGGDTTTGKLFRGLGNIAGQSALGGLAGGIPGAVAFGGLSAVRELAELSRLSREHADNRERAMRAAIQEAQATGLQVQAQIRGVGQEALPGPTPTFEQQLDTLKILEQLGIARQQEHDTRRNELFRTNPALFTETGQLAKEQRSLINQEIDAARLEIDRLQNAQAVGGLLGMVGRSAIGGGGALSRGISGGLTSLRGFLAGPTGRAAQAFRQMQEQLEFRDLIIARVMGMRGQSSAIGAPLAIRGTNDYLRAISDQPKTEKDIGELVKIAKEELELEKTQAREIAKEIARQQITVSM